jgi:hypothetical protein
MKKREAAIISAYTGMLLCDFSDFKKYAEEIMGRPIFTHEMASPGFCFELKIKAEADAKSIVVE